jgi:hypothetical protein
MKYAGAKTMKSHVRWGKVEGGGGEGKSKGKGGWWFGFEKRPSSGGTF